MSQDHTHTEKRKEPRYPIDATVRISDRGQHCSIYGECQNLSQSGLLVRTRAPISRQHRLKVRIYEAGAVFDGEAEVVHTRQDGDAYLTGFKTEFKPGDPD